MVVDLVVFGRQNARDSGRAFIFYDVFDVAAPINRHRHNGKNTVSININSSISDETSTRQSKFALKLPAVHVNQYNVVVMFGAAAPAGGLVIAATTAVNAHAYNNIYILYTVLFIWPLESVFNESTDIIGHFVRAFFDDGFFERTMDHQPAAIFFHIDFD